MVYKFKHGFRCKVKAQIVGERLTEIKNANAGRLTTEAVVADAKSDDSPLHDAGFTWDVEEAAEKRWRDEARQLIHSVYVVHLGADGKEQRVLGYVNVPDADVGRCYVPTSEMAYNDELRQLAEAEAFKSLQAWRDRYAHIQALSEIIQTIDRAMARAKPKLTQKPQRRPAVVHARA
jgi:hypothetical protein